MNLMPASYNLPRSLRKTAEGEGAATAATTLLSIRALPCSARERDDGSAVDAVFESIRTDREFVALTKDADGRLPIPMKGMPATQASPNR
jgi:hypothetical protein